MKFIAYGSSLDSTTPAGAILRRLPSPVSVEINGYRITFRGGCTSLAGQKGGTLHGVAYEITPELYKELGQIENSQIYGLGSEMFILGNTGPATLKPDAAHVTRILEAYDAMGLPTEAYLELHRAVGLFAEARRKAALAAKKAAKKAGKTLAQATRGASS